VTSIDIAPLEGAVVERVSYAPAHASTTAVYVAVFAFIAGTFATVLAGFAVNISMKGGWDLAPSITGLAISIAAIVGGLGYLIVLIAKGFRARPSVVSRLSDFARANRLQHTPHSATPAYPGAIFGWGVTRWAFHRLATTAGRFVEVGNVGYRVPAGRTQVTETWGYVAMRLDRALPHMLLESTKHGQETTGALPVSVDRSQRLSLEGDFDRHFTLYCPAEYETDALYIFAPDLMALVVDEVGPLHVEIIDDWLFVYSPDDFTGYDAAAFERLYRMIEVLKVKALRQTRAYRDDRAAAPVDGASNASGTAIPAVAEQGARMQPGTPQYTRLFRLSLGVMGIIIVLFVVTLFVLVGLSSAAG
jgi:hypothetical protein